LEPGICLSVGVAGVLAACMLKTQQHGPTRLAPSDEVKEQNSIRVREQKTLISNGSYEDHLGKGGGSRSLVIEGYETTLGQHNLRNLQTNQLQS
jgi:hypothetical protein